MQKPNDHYNGKRIAAIFAEKKGGCLAFKNNGMTHITGWTAQSVKELPGNDETLVFYPNPVKNILYSLAFTSGSTVFVFNAQGSLIKECKPANSQIDLSHLPSGLYYFYIFDGNRNSKGKFVRD